jgi:hypothetical protein
MASSDSAAEMMLNFSNLKDAALSGGAVVNEAKSYMGECAHGNVEIEGRLGRFGGEGFVTNIGSPAFCTVLRLLETFPRWSSISPWVETQDVFYTLQLPTSHGGAERSTRVQVRTSVSTENGLHNIVHMVKRKIKSADFGLQSLDQGSCAIGVDTGNLINDVGGRLSASVEKPLSPDLLPVAVMPDVVRIKERKRFLLPSLGIEGDAFAFDASIVFTGLTKSDAEKAQKRNEGGSFEIEVECLAPRQYLESCSGEGSCLALSILVKLLDFASHLNQNMTVTFIPRSLKGVHPPMGPGGSSGNTTAGSGISGVPASVCFAAAGSVNILTL